MANNFRTHCYCPSQMPNDLPKKKIWNLQAFASNFSLTKYLWLKLRWIAWRLRSKHPNNFPTIKILFSSLLLYRTNKPNNNDDENSNNITVAATTVHGVYCVRKRRRWQYKYMCNRSLFVSLPLCLSLLLPLPLRHSHSLSFSHAACMPLCVCVCMLVFSSLSLSHFHSIRVSFTVVHTLGVPKHTPILPIACVVVMYSLALSLSSSYGGWLILNWLLLRLLIQQHWFDVALSVRVCVSLIQLCSLWWLLIENREKKHENILWDVQFDFGRSRRCSCFYVFLCMYQNQRQFSVEQQTSNRMKIFIVWRSWSICVSGIWKCSDWFFFSLLSLAKW